MPSGGWFIGIVHIDRRTGARTLLYMYSLKKKPYNESMMSQQSLSVIALTRVRRSMVDFRSEMLVFVFDIQRQPTNLYFEISAEQK